MAKYTYRASSPALVTTGTATKSFASIIGSATMRVIVTRIRVSAPTTTSVAYNTINVCKNSTATATPGAVLTNVPLNTAFPAATNAVNTWTADQTVGTLVGIVDSWRCLLQSTTAAAGGIPDYHVFNFGDLTAGHPETELNPNRTSGIVLNGTAQELSLQWNATVAAAATLAVSFEWIEESTSFGI
jgi:hypothetical protein